MVRYEYKVVSLKAAQIVNPHSAAASADAALTLFESILNKEAEDGWEFDAYIPELRERVAAIEWDAIVFKRRLAEDA